MIVIKNTLKQSGHVRHIKFKMLNSRQLCVSCSKLPTSNILVFRLFIVFYIHALTAPIKVGTQYTVNVRHLLCHFEATIITALNSVTGTSL